MFFIVSFKCFDLKNVLAISPILFPDSISPSSWTWRLLAQRPLHTIKASYAFIPSNLTSMMASQLSAPVNFEHTSGRVGNIYAPENTSNTIIFSRLSTCCLWPPRKHRGGCECFPVLADLPPSSEMEMIRWQDLSPCQQKVVKTSGTGTWMAAQSTLRGSQDECFPAPSLDQHPRGHGTQHPLSLINVVLIWSVVFKLCPTQSEMFCPGTMVRDGVWAKIQAFPLLNWTAPLFVF